MSQPIIANSYSFKVSLVDSANPGNFKVNPTIGAGDFKVSVNGGALTNLTAVPTLTPSGMAIVQVTLTASEMWAADPVVYGASSAHQWLDMMVDIHTTTDSLYLMKLAGLLSVDMSSLATAGARSPVNALRTLRNRLTSSGGILTVYGENDTTKVWTATLTTNNSALPVVEMDPA